MVRIRWLFYGVLIGSCLMFLLTVKQKQVCQVIQNPLVQFLVR